MAVQQCLPEPVQVVSGEVHPAVAVAPYREVQHVGAVALFVQVAERSIPREVIGAEKCGACESRPVADFGLDQFMKIATAHAFGDEREHHVSAVAVGESRAGRELLREAVEGGQERLGFGEHMERQREDVVADINSEQAGERLGYYGGVKRLRG